VLVVIIITFNAINQQDMCDAHTNPQGHVALCVAENKLVIDLIADRFTQVGTATAAFAHPDVYCYNAFLGMPLAREAAAYFLARRFYRPHDDDVSPEQALQWISPNHVGLGSGAASLLNALFFLLGEAGDACLVPRPYYAAFENDMNLIAGIVPCGITQANPVAGPTEQELEVAHAETRAKGLRPKFILLTNPNNPLGSIYRRDVLLRIVQWARKRGMHVIVDEIYALSTHKVRVL
jgi:aspartate/methionine/tyrosine aminotransferase